MSMGEDKRGGAAGKSTPSPEPSMEAGDTFEYTVNKHGKVTDPEVWMDYWSEELLTLWHDMQDRCGMMGAAVLDVCDFPAFAQFCWEHSSRYPPVA